MRILLVSNYGRNVETSFQYKVITAFEKYGHIMEHLYPRNGPIIKQIISKKMSPPDLVLYMEGLLFENPNWLKLPFKIPKFWWFLDTPILFNHQVNWYKITDADLALVRDRREIKRFEDNGLKCVWAPPKIDPNIFNIKEPNREYDVGFVGWVDESRYNWLNDFTYISDRVMAAGDARLEHVPKFTYFYNGKKWNQIDMVGFYNTSKIVPHRTGRYTTNIVSARGIQGDITWRPFEATACRAMLLTEEFDAIDDLFVRGKEIVVYDMSDDPKSRLELASYYLEHEEEMNNISRNGWVRTMKDHTWKSISDLIEREVKKIGM